MSYSFYNHFCPNNRTFIVVPFIPSCCKDLYTIPGSWKAENIPVLAWPAYSPDMSPIEHVWDALDRRIRQCAPVPANIQQLHTAIKEEWTNITQTTINNLINSMWRRCVALCEANGGHTKYWLVPNPPGCVICNFLPPPPPPPPFLSENYLNGNFYLYYYNCINFLL